MSDRGENSFTIEAAGHRLRARRIGEAAAPDVPTLVFLHEGLGSIGQWRGVPEDLCRLTGLPGLVYERWGFGQSEKLKLPRPKDYMTREAEQALPDVLRACAVQRPILIGHSDGGSIALLYAAAFPHAVAACISIAAHVFVEDETIRGIREVVARWDSGDLKPRLARYHGDNTDAMFRGWAETWLRADFRDWNIEACLSRILCPTLIVQGEKDEHATLAQVDAIAGSVSGLAETYVVPGVGHSPHLEAREPMLTHMAAFIATHVGTGPGN
jgi:pimeloyl-ACP methyl ester carboxylesterase